MRVTNKMMTTQSLININNNKSMVNTLNTQMSTQKKISRPSDDPVVAIRSLRLKSTLTEINQYVDKNISDAASWLDSTETSLSSMESLLSDIYEQAVYGSTDTLDDDDRNTILENLSALADQVYEEGNADLAGRYLFTGYKTNTSLTFPDNDTTTSYEITEPFSGSDIETTTYIKNKQDVTYGTVAATVNTPEDIEIHRIRLAYDNIEVPTSTGTVSLSYTDSTGTLVQLPLTYTSLSLVGDTAYEPAADEVNFIPETGELIIGDNILQELQGNTGEMSLTYQKTGFEKGELRPEHYFDCENLTTGITFTKDEQAIEYTISFNQPLKINTEASDVFNTSLARDVEEMMSSVSAALEANEKVESIEKMLEDSQFQDETSQTNLQAMLEAAQKEADLSEAAMQDKFSNSISKVQNYLESVDLAITDCGTRSSRLEITQNRLEAQQTTFEGLKSDNEDVELSDVLIEYTAAETAYDAALVAASKTLQTSLLDYI